MTRRGAVDAFAIGPFLRPAIRREMPSNDAYHAISTSTYKGNFALKELNQVDTDMHDAQLFEIQSYDCAVRSIGGVCGPSVAPAYGDAAISCPPDSPLQLERWSIGTSQSHYRYDGW